VRTSALFSTKNVGCFEIYGVSARIREGKGGIEPVRAFCGKGGSIFRDFVRTSFMDGPLSFICTKFSYESLLFRHHPNKMIAGILKL